MAPAPAETNPDASGSVLSTPSVPLVGCATQARQAERAGAISDIVNLFASFGPASASASYQEIQSDTTAQAVAARWPLVNEWIAATQASTRTGH
jgi:hypothetical protein